LSSAAVVTGHSRGLGAGIAAALLTRDVRVLGISRGENANLAARHGKALTQVRLDLADSNALRRWLESGALKEFAQRADSAILVNNAGLLQPIGPLERQDLRAVADAVAVNLSAVLVLSAAFVQATEHARDRRILHIASGAATKAYAGWSVYCATKAALHHHARAVALDRTPGLRICSVAPGIVETEMQREIRGSTDDRFPERQRFIALNRDGKLKDADETGAAAVELLLSSRFGSEPTAELPATR
jgi:benzil reductase ((S)-benzoin forming)